MKTSPMIKVCRVRVLWANRKGELLPRYAYRAVNSKDGSWMGYPQATAKLARAWA